MSTRNHSSSRSAAAPATATVRVIARVRPLLAHENERDIALQADPDTAIVKIPNPKNENEEYSFKFQAVFDAEATQADVFEKEVAPTIPHLFKGHDVTLFAYGVTGTGKTHTMRGGKTLADRGMIPRLLSSIFRRAKRLEKASESSNAETRVEVRISYYEIYNDKVYDLLEPPEKRTPTGLPIREAGGGKVVVVGLTEEVCHNLKDFESLYDKGNGNRSTAGTKLNAVSSRSHAILSVKLIVSTVDDNENMSVRISTASCIDLAGSEDNRRTENVGGRMVESASINRSLFVLAQCVEAISKKQHRIPYRESKMTRILSLGQNKGITVMILNIAPLRSYQLDTLSSLNFANRTKKIETRDVENELLTKGAVKASHAPAAAGESLGRRQPLRPLALAAGVNKILAKEKLEKEQQQKKKKLAKEFSVYSDGARSKRSDQHTVDGLVAQPKRALHEAVPKRSSPLKRGIDVACVASTRPTKSIKATPSFIRRPAADTQFMSKETIESLVQEKVEEILAARMKEQEDAQQAQKLDSDQPDISVEVQRRLDELERKIAKKEAEDDGRTEGLSYLLMGKQHQMKGEDEDALQMYEVAKKWFPENRKLDIKIRTLKQKLGHTDEEAVAETCERQQYIYSTDKPGVRHSRVISNGRRKELRLEAPVEEQPAAVDDEEYREEPEESSASETDDSDDFHFKCRSRIGRSRTKSKRSNKSKRASKQTSLNQQEYHGVAKPKSLVETSLVPTCSSAHASLCFVDGNTSEDIIVTAAATATISDIESGSETEVEADVEQQSPRTRALLGIVNSKDVCQIRLLKGVGARRAEAILDSLDGGRQLQSLDELASLKGVGGKCVEGMRLGLVVE